MVRSVVTGAFSKGGFSPAGFRLILAGRQAKIHGGTSQAGRIKGGAASIRNAPVG
jgi:hypothetical protein